MGTQINKLAEDVPCIRDAHKAFLKKILKARLEAFCIECMK